MSHDSGINGGQFGGYFFMDDGFSYYTALGGLEFDGYSTSRLLDFDDVNRTAVSNYDGWQSFAYLERGFSFQSCMSVFQPFVAIQYIYLRQNSFTESGADSVDLAGGGATANSLRSMLGARWQYAMMNRNGLRTLPELHALWMHEYLDSNTSVSEQFSPTPTGSMRLFDPRPRLRPRLGGAGRELDLGNARLLEHVRQLRHRIQLAA